MPRRREWTERDVAILRELYELRELTKAQIATKHFDGNMKYASKRLYIMRTEGLISSEVYGTRVNGRTQVAAYCRLTEQGMELLRTKGILNKVKYRARDLGLSVQQREYIMSANELHVRIPEVPFMDSRSIKRKYNLNRGNLTVGGFSTESGDYMIYILRSDALDKTLVKIISEIKQLRKLKGFLVYYKSQSVKRSFEAISEQIGLVTGGIPIHLLPFDETGFKITREYILSNAFLKLKNLFKDYGEFTEVPGQSKYGFRYGIYQKRIEGERSGPYVVELITGDMLILKRCLRNYNSDLSQRVGRRVLLFCYEEEVERYREELLSASHVDIVGISKDLI